MGTAADPLLSSGMLDELRRRAPARGRASDRDRARATWSRSSSESSKTASGSAESAGEEPGASAWDDSSSEASKIASESSETTGDLGVGVAEVVCGSAPESLGSITGEEDSGSPLVVGAAAGPAPDPSKPATGEQGWGPTEPGVVAEEWSSEPVRSGGPADTAGLPGAGPAGEDGVSTPTLECVDPTSDSSPLDEGSDPGNS
ncbi:hypothetical protein PF002_g23732 [Phytophthora fragariae]|uniref:Uncharacterized protein n=1 Tax=Phytophthora fragariae TaxID=53985 RepID=A0A6A3X0R6_9STRA|nr:hypothetical protein PF003_g17970 [Phytophthora fragariae]KAE9194011.1 hypothetical protein PF002_g23732 [Phytophthora fragariae]